MGCHIFNNITTAIENFIFPDTTLVEEKKHIERWKRSGLPVETYHANPKEAKELMKMHLHHCISYYGHEVKIGASSGLEILCDGTYTPFSTILNDTSEWNYLPNGLTKRSLVNWHTFEPITRLTAAEVSAVQQRAVKLPSPLMTPSEKPPHVLQIVSSWSEPLLPKYCPCTDEADAQLNQPQHPWLRLMTPEGDLYSAGFNWGKTLGATNIAETVESRFRSPDLWEALPFNARIVTNIAISEEQFEVIKHDIQQGHTEGLAFNFVTQNCSTYISHTLKKLGFTPKFHMSLGELFWKSLPKPAILTVQFMCDAISLLTPPLVSKIVAVALDRLKSAAAYLLAALLGGTTGVTKAQVKHGFIDKETNRPAVVQESQVIQLCDLSNPTDEIYLPRKVVEWLMLQPSTVYLNGREPNRFYEQFR
ncbi:MAG: hypothetical protein JSR46_02520 [Verrucomicrobia bacterium]|nr:hypothetical protein [Verrucomicrobiota bacterium]